MQSADVMGLSVDNILKAALKEDIPWEDVTANAIIPATDQGAADVICKESGVLAGIDVFFRVFELLDPSCKIEAKVKDGDKVKSGQIVAIMKGKLRCLLAGERTALNILQRMSGIATQTRRLADCLAESSTVLLDTRKTTPGLRILEKYAVRVGGGRNHRYSLSDGVLIKDNHISAAGSITKAIKLAKGYAPFVRKIEIEVENLGMVKEAIHAGADIIMLDNMSVEEIHEAVKYIAGRAETECSGNMDEGKILALKGAGLTYISCGALTHSIKSLDFSLKNMRLTT